MYDIWQSVNVSLYSKCISEHRGNGFSVKTVKGTKFNWISLPSPITILHNTSSKGASLSVACSIALGHCCHLSCQAATPSISTGCACEDQESLSSVLWHKFCLCFIVTLPEATDKRNIMYRAIHSSC